MRRVCTFIPTCHPERKGAAKGLCNSCYQKKYYQDRKNGVIRPKINSKCHPDRKHYGKGYCAPCYRVANREKLTQLSRDWRLKNKDGKYKEIQLRRLGKRAGVTQDVVNLLTTKQNGCCAICECLSKLYRDHNHKTGKFRGLLCHMCNSGIGSLQDNPTILQRAIQYLNENSV